MRMGKGKHLKNRFDFCLSVCLSVCLIAILTIITGCGDKGGDDNDPSPPANEYKNKIPVAFEGSSTTQQGITIQGKAMAQDEDDAYIKYILVSNVANGFLTMDENNGSFTYTPNSAFIGVDFFSFKAWDGKEYSEEKSVTLVVDAIQPVATGTDSTPPEKTRIVAVNTTDTDALTLFWIASEDNVTTAENVIYEVHVSTASDFTPDPSTQKATFKNVMEADVKGLDAGTEYFLRVKAIDEAGNASVSDAETITTLAQSAVPVSTTSVKKSDDLFIHDVELGENQLVYDDKGQSLPAVGDVLVGDANDAFLKKVDSVTQSDGKVRIDTIDIAMSDIFESMTARSKVTLFDDVNTPETKHPEKSGIRRTRHYKLNGDSERKLSWGSGRLSVKQPVAKKASGPVFKPKSHTVSDSVIEISTENGVVSVMDGETLVVDFSAKIKDDETDGFKLASMYLKSLTHPEYEHSNFFNAYFTTTTSTDTSRTGQFRWPINQYWVSKEPFTAKIEVRAKDIECSSILDSCNDKYETIEIEIYVTDTGEVNIGKTHNTSKSTDLSLSNEVTLEFNPVLVTDTVLDGREIQRVEISLEGHAVFQVVSTLKFKAAANTEYSVFIVPAKTITSLYMVGSVPVYQEITYSIEAVFKGSAEGAIEAVSNLNISDFMIKAGLVYEDGAWKTITGKNIEKDYTASFTVAGGAKVEIRLIPDIQVSFYKAATAGLSVEPWVKGDIGAEGALSFNTDFEAVDFLSIYRLKNLNILLGVDANFFADVSIWGYNVFRYPEGGGRKNILGPDFNWLVFSLPTISLEKEGDPCADQSITISAAIADGVNNPFNDHATEWRVFPEDGATVEPSGADPKQATLSFNKQDEYTVYFIGSSQKLGEIFGQQYEAITIDTRDCEAVCTVDQKFDGVQCVPKTCRDDQYNCPVCASGQEMVYKKDGGAYCNTSPGVTITGPAGNSVYPKGTRITFTGTATDPEDGPLSQYKLTWSSDLNGLLGIGSPFSTDGLKPGTHTITLTVTDSAGKSSIAMTKIVIKSSNQYTITATAGTGGYISPAGTMMVNSGETKTWNIGASSGHTISNVTVNGVSRGVVSTVTLSNIAEDYDIIAYFESTEPETPPAPLPYIITASAGANGTISPSGNVSVSPGATQTFTFSPSGGYRVANVLVDGVSVGAPASYPFTSVNHTISVTFEAIPCAAFPAPLQSIPANGETVDSVTPSLSWQASMCETTTPIYRVMIAPQASDLPTTDTPLCPNCVYNDKTGENVTTLSVPEGVGLVDGNTYYWQVRAGGGGKGGEWSEKRSFTVDLVCDVFPAPLQSTPAEAETVDSVTPSLSWQTSVCDTTSPQYRVMIAPQASDLPTTDSPLCPNCVYNDKTAENVTTLSVPEGVGLVDGNTYYWQVRAGGEGKGGAWSAKRSFTVDLACDAFPAPLQSTPAEAETVDSVTPILSWQASVCDATVPQYRVMIAPQASDLPTTDSPLCPNCVYNDKTAENVTTLSVPEGAGLTDGNTYYWQVRAGGGGKGGEWSEKHAFTVEEKKFTLTSTAGTGGQISPSGPTLVKQGGSQVYVITPYSGYSIAYVLVDGASVGAVSSYTFSNVTAEHEIYAIFYENAPPPPATYTITASAGANGSITPTGAVSVTSGSNQTFTFTPSGGYQVANVLVDGASVGAPASYPFTNVTANHTISVIFQVIPCAAFPAPVQSTPANAGTVDSVTPDLTWQAAVCDATVPHYRVMIAPLAADLPTTDTTLCPNCVYNDTTADNATSLNVPAGAGLADTNTYYWQIRAGGDGKGGAWSAKRSFTVDLACDAFPAPVQSAPANGGNVYSVTPKLTWQAAVCDATVPKYRVMIAPLAADLPTTDTTVCANCVYNDVTADNATSLNVPAGAGLADTNTYYWQIRAGGDGKGGAWSAKRSFTVDTSIPAALQRTGQTTCYDAAGNVIACAGTGQDGDLLMGVALPAPRFTDNGDGTVTDNLTDLIWLKNVNCGGTMTWQNALNYCNAIQDGDCGLTDGSSPGDWRLPNRKELFSLIDFEESSPALPLGHPFTNVGNNFYWSATTFASSTDGAWLVDLLYGFVGYDYKTHTVYVWPVRAGQ